MNIQPAFKKDVRRKQTHPGAYEWWYFDAISEDGDTAFVIIFYRGNPFSRRYINHQQQEGTTCAGDFPAISISIYRHQKPVYYGFTEFERGDALFEEHEPLVRIGEHEMIGRSDGDEISFTLNLNEKLPSGDAVEGRLVFRSASDPKHVIKKNGDEHSGHLWDVVQPWAKVTGELNCSVRNGKNAHINFEGHGYHDHNQGREPLKNHFEDWYWGRFHFKDTTLIYYAANQQQDDYGWLLRHEDMSITHIFDSFEMEDTSLNLYGLRTARKLILSNGDVSVMVQQGHLLDNGPFYQRFSSDAFLHISEQDILQSSKGISEYLCPPRIYKRRFWPLTNMRIRYKMEDPHWVQRFPTLYRWTW